ncbi:Alpha/beta hydrolase family protein [Planctomycetes bacterium Poly30]|uniref:Alpha/beta hydrolase family protein n=1 Tax=Saltatorellus ferox TaxID=2528018 RepID=A0A518EUE9_9BACT|nr:Alpha/beta hydrolase family protein [Planctomycetes bacterium Poly30]
MHALILVLPALLLLGVAETPATQEPSITDSNAPLQFEVVRPEGMAAGVTGPVLVALPPAVEHRSTVEAGLPLDWLEEALRLRWTVIIPTTPAAERTPDGSNLPALIELLDHVVERFSVEGGRVHLAGIADGGSTASKLALAQPDRFASLTLLPTLPPGLDLGDIGGVGGLPIAVFTEDEGQTPGSPTARTLFHTLESLRVADALRDFHDAASKADGERYFAHFAEGAIYMGTDATERWTLAEFRSFAEPYFSKGRGWTYVASERHVYVSEDGQTAWFDELLDNSSYGVTRGTGVFVRGADRWRMAQYHLTIPVPNDLAKTLVELIREQEK